MLESILTLASVVVFFFGAGIFSLAFKPGYKKVSALISGLLVMALAVYVMPPQTKDEPEIYYRK